MAVSAPDKAALLGSNPGIISPEHQPDGGRSADKVKAMIQLALTHGSHRFEWIITRFDGKTIEKASDLPRFVGSIKPGTRTTFTVFRRGANKELSVVIGEPEPEKAVARKPADREDKAKPSASVQLLGLSVGELAEAQKKELKIRGGVKVDAATEGAARAGLREGDVITQVANQEVLSVKDFDAVVARLEKGKPVSILFRRGEWAQYALIRPVR